MTTIRPSLGSLQGLATVLRSITSLLLVEPIVDLSSRKYLDFIVLPESEQDLDLLHALVDKESDAVSLL
jgi:hypothetical protein